MTKNKEVDKFTFSTGLDSLDDIKHDCVTLHAQVVLDVFHSGDERYLLPIKVQDLSRHSSTMYTLHSCKDNSFKPRDPKRGGFGNPGIVT